MYSSLFKFIISMKDKITRSSLAVFARIILLAILIFSNLHVFAQKTPDSLPDFTFYKLDGTVFNRQQLIKGSHTIFILYDCGCEHCQRELIDIGKHYTEFRNVNFYLVTMDRKQEIDKFMLSYGRYLNGKPNVLLLQDKNMEFIPKFKPLRYPGIFVYSSAGKCLYSNSGTTPLKAIFEAISKG